MVCISLVTYKMMINGDHSQEFIPSRGLRQGDPLSPHLFLFIQEAFSQLITRAIGEAKITGIQPRRLCPSISHLLFANETLIFMQASCQAAQNLKAVLNLFTSATGQTVNFHKSLILFLANTPSELRENVRNSLGVCHDPL